MSAARTRARNAQCWTAWKTQEIPVCIWRQARAWRSATATIGVIDARSPAHIDVSGGRSRSRAACAGAGSATPAAGAALGATSAICAQKPASGASVNDKPGPAPKAASQASGVAGAQRSVHRTLGPKDAASLMVFRRLAWAASSLLLGPLGTPVAAVLTRAGVGSATTAASAWSGVPMATGVPSARRIARLAARAPATR